MRCAQCGVEDVGRGGGDSPLCVARGGGGGALDGGGGGGGDDAPPRALPAAANRRRSVGGKTHVDLLLNLFFHQRYAYSIPNLNNVVIELTY